MYFKAVLMLLALVSMASAVIAAEVYSSPPDIWRGYDPTALPLDIEVLKRWEDGGCWYEKLRFTGEIADGIKTRVLAIRGAPVNARNVPGILHIHGGGQTLSEAWVRFWASRGYGCVSFDFCGKAYDRTEYTDWGPLKTCNMPDAGDGVFATQGLKSSSWYHWTLACRRALTLLGQTSGVDEYRMGIFGVSVGGTLCWMVAGADDRVKASAPIYGCGYNIDPRRGPREAGAVDADHWYFKKILSPEAWAPYNRCPVLLLDATNDGHGRMPTAYECLSATAGTQRIVFTPQYDHHIEPKQARDLPLWMDWRLKQGKAFPDGPVVSVALGAKGVPMAHVNVASPADVTKVEVYYSLEDKVPMVRFWRRSKVSVVSGTYSAALPVMDTWKSLHVFANVFYRSGVCLSSNLVDTIPAQLGKARATLRWNAEWDKSHDIRDTWYFVPAYTDPNVDWSYISSGRGSSGDPYVSVKPDGFGSQISYYIGSYAIGDDQFEGKPGQSLGFQVRGAHEGDLEVILGQDERLIGGKSFTARVPCSRSEAGWQEVDLPLSAFKDDEGHSPESWSRIDKISLKGVTSKDSPPCFKDFRWLAQQAGN